MHHRTCPRCQSPNALSGVFGTQTVGVECLLCGWEQSWPSKRERERALALAAAIAAEPAHLRRRGRPPKKWKVSSD